jgi:hypothetical protein
MPNRADPAELFDIEMDEFAWVLALVAAYRFRLQGAEFVQAQPTQNAAHGGVRDADLGSDRLASQPLAPKRRDAFNNRLRRRPAQAMGSRAAILQTGDTFTIMPLQPFAHCPRADAYGLPDGLRRLPACSQVYNSLSTPRRQAGILVHVHPVLRDC